MRVLSRKTVLCVIGTRPEAIKMAPVIRALKECAWARCRVLKSGQHRELVDAMLEFFDIEPDFDLDLMQPGQAPAELTRRILGAMRGALAVERPDMVLRRATQRLSSPRRWRVSLIESPSGTSRPV